ncbi:MAG: segregation/condensation protein A [Lachnospiraceae bacterium]|nr:segregation/condensation protein A [Lachnospiraceae bacterium]
MEKITYKLEKFEGPLDLLLHLIEKNKIDIFDIPIAMITNQFLEYMGKMQEADMDLSSDFLVMASTLLEIKSKMLLPFVKDDNGEEIDPRQSLVERLLEYKKYKNLGYELSDFEDDAPEYMLKKPTIPQDVKSYIPSIDYEELLKGIDVNKLNEVFTEVLRRKRDSIDTMRAGFGKLEKEKVPLKDTIISVIKYANLNKKFSFKELLEEQNDKTHVIVSFLAVLELMKVGRIKVTQENSFSEIFIEVVEGATGFVDFDLLEDD